MPTRGAARHTLTGHTGPVWAVAVTADGRHAITGSDDGTARVWDLATGAELTAIRFDSPTTCAAISAQPPHRLVIGTHSGTTAGFDLADT